MSECGIDNCERPALARGWCGAHYQRWKKHGDPLGSTPRRQRAQCSVDQCSREAEAHGLCVTHVSRLRRTGTAEDRPLAIERFDEFVERRSSGECWPWLGPTNNAGYGRCSQQYAHRIACERAHGEAPAVDSVAMHSCDNPPCVNPAHLSWGTQQQNIRDSWTRTRKKEIA